MEKIEHDKKLGFSLKNVEKIIKKLKKFLSNFSNLFNLPLLTN